MTSDEDRLYKEFLKLDGKFKLDASVALAIIQTSLGEGPLGRIAHISSCDDSDHAKARRILELLQRVKLQNKY